MVGTQPGGVKHPDARFEADPTKWSEAMRGTSSKPWFEWEHVFDAERLAHRVCISFQNLLDHDRYPPQCPLKERAAPRGAAPGRGRGGGGGAHGRGLALPAVRPQAAGVRGSLRRYSRREDVEAAVAPHGFRLERCQPFGQMTGGCVPVNCIFARADVRLPWSSPPWGS